MVKYLIAAFVLLFAIAGSRQVSASGGEAMRKPDCRESINRYAVSKISDDAFPVTADQFCQLRRMPLQFFR